MDYKADVPNFLEPWYGIGTIASAYGGNYIWNKGQAPAFKPLYTNLDEVLSVEPTPVIKTEIGLHTLQMIEYFMDRTRGKLPVSFTDSQSPLNIAGNILPIDELLMQVMLAPEKVLQFFDILAGLSNEFNKEQARLIGDALALPGHGFSSSREWKGFGLSDDNALMISPEQYLEIAMPSVVKISQEFGGLCFHSCGNWEGWTDAVLKIPGLIMADGAFSPETDPDANTNLEAFHKFAYTGVILNARIVGDLNTVHEQVKRLWVPGMKLIVVTYCESVEEQEAAYNLIHNICTD